MNILIAEDDQNDLTLLQRALKRISQIKSINSVRNGREVICYILGEGPYENRAVYPLPNLIFLDIKMPVMDGLETLSWIRQHSNQKRVPVIVFTSSMDHNHKVAAYTNGANSYLIKSPLIHMTDTLVSVLKYWITENQSPEIPHD